MRGLSQSLELQLSNANLVLSDLIDVCSKYLPFGTND